MGDVSLNTLFGQPPEKSINFLKQKEVAPSLDWQEVQGVVHNRAFVVAQMTRLDLLEDVRQSIVDALAQGKEFKQWADEIKPVMQAKGWWGKEIRVDGLGNAKEVQLGSPTRLQTIYRNNIAQAYEAGRQAEMWSDDPDDPFPNVMYAAVMDSRTRPRHAALNGVVMRKGDPAWSAIAPKCGYNCRCTVIEMTDGQVRRGGHSVRDSKGFVYTEQVEVGIRSGNPRTANRTVVAFPDLPLFKTDAGWGGKATALPTQTLLNKAAFADPRIASAVVQSVVRDPAALKSLNDEFRKFAEQILNALPKPGNPPTRLKMTGALMHIGAIPKNVVDELTRIGKPLKSAVLSVRDEDVVHAHVPDKTNPVDRAWYLDLPMHLAIPEAVLLDTQKGDDALIFVYSVAGNQKSKIVVMTDQTVKTRVDGKIERLNTNIVRNAQVVQKSNLTSSLYVLLAGKVL